MIRSILAALDSSVRAAGVFEFAVDLAQSLGASLRVLRVISVPPEFPPLAHVSHHDGLPGHLRRRAHAELRALADRAPALRIETLVFDSTQPWRAIIELADQIPVDLIVVGSHGYNYLDYLLGTNAGRVANLAHRPVLVVHGRPNDHAVKSEPR